MIVWNRSRTILAGALLAALGVCLCPGSSRAADHRDSPRLMANVLFEGNIDINDVYLFKSPVNKANTVIIVTLSPAAGVVGPATFHPFALYEVRLQNTAAIADNMVFQFTFSVPDAFGRQNMQVIRQSTNNSQPLVTQAGLAPAGSIVNQQIAFGPTGRPLALRGGGQVIAGLYDDPFFFDLNAFNTLVSRANAGASLAKRIAPFQNPSFPDNFFGTFNVLALVMEVPTASLQSSRANTKFAIWVRTVFNGEQVDRMARPAINTATIPQALKGAFNVGTPFSDQALFTNGVIEDEMHLYGVSSAYGLKIAQTVLPDLLTYDASSTSGFLNGRKLDDDVIDAELALLTNGGLTTDRVGNDSFFSGKFPYLGSAQPHR